MGASSEFFAGGYFGHAAAEPEMKQEPFDGGVGAGNNGGFAVDDLLDFPKEEEMIADDAFFDSITAEGGNNNNSGEAESSALTSCNSSVSGGDAGGGQFNGDLSCRSFTDTQFSSAELCVPYEDLAELEWLSNFVEESFSTDDLHNLRLISPATNSKPQQPPSATTNAAVNPSPIFPADVSVPAKARSKRSRADPSKWATRLLLLSSPATSSSENPDPINPNAMMKMKAPKTTPCKKREAVETPGRKCLHCGSDKTPQWRTGPMGPKTLCNACGVRYKSGRLVPEYRPAASPTFISAKHSNSHRKVLELRRQKEMMRHHHHHHQQQHQMITHSHSHSHSHSHTQASMFGVSNGQDDFLIHQTHHHHPHQQDYRLMI